MEFSLGTWIFAILGGILAGIINTLAGSGSLVTLPMLVFLGLPASVANGTNRVGIIFQCATSALTFKKQGTLETERAHWFIIPTLLGAILGALVAVELDDSVINITIGVLMVVMLVLTLLDPKKWLREVSENQQGRPKVWMLALFFLIGIYGGFLQAGSGVMLLVALVLGAGYTVLAANGIKVLIALCFSIAALFMFAANDLVYWPLGFLMAIGQALGAWFAARYLATAPGATAWVRRLLIVIILIGIARFLGLPAYQWLMAN